ncbi:MAG: hypothetical protein Q9170_006188 [Blastenia crenularia]
MKDEIKHPTSEVDDEYLVPEVDDAKIVKISDPRGNVKLYSKAEGRIRADVDEYPGCRMRDDEEHPASEVDGGKKTKSPGPLEVQGLYSHAEGNIQVTTHGTKPVRSLTEGSENPQPYTAAEGRNSIRSLCFSKRSSLRRPLIMVGKEYVKPEYDSEQDLRSRLDGRNTGGVHLEIVEAAVNWTSS